MQPYAGCLLILCLLCLGECVMLSNRMVGYSSPDEWILVDEQELYHIRWIDDMNIKGINHYNTSDHVIDVLLDIKRGWICAVLVKDMFECFEMGETYVDPLLQQTLFYDPTTDYAIFDNLGNIFVLSDSMIEVFSLVDDQFVVKITQDIFSSSSLWSLLVGSFLSVYSKTESSGLLLIDEDRHVVYKYILIVKENGSLDLNLVFSNVSLSIFTSSDTLYFQMYERSHHSNLLDQLVIQRIDAFGHNELWFFDVVLVPLTNQLLCVDKISLSDDLFTTTNTIVRILPFMYSDDTGSTCVQVEQRCVEIFSHDDELFKYYDLVTKTMMTSRPVIVLNNDPDMDGILTKFELGCDHNAPLHKFGNTPFVPDVNLEVDYMKGLRPKPGAISILEQSFADNGMHLYVRVDEELPFIWNIGSDNFIWERDFDAAYKEPYHNIGVGFFHYCLFINGYGGSTSSGKGKFRGGDFIVSLGFWPEKGNEQQQAGTIMHELGHNFGLLHGGWDGINYKPNYFSVMNYLFQMDGIQVKNSFGKYKTVYRYSTSECNAIDERNVSESKGVQCDQDETYIVYLKSNGVKQAMRSSNEPIDWNNDGEIEDGKPIELTDDEQFSYLHGGNNEYEHLYLAGIGNDASSIYKEEESEMESELNLEDWKMIKEIKI